MKRCLLGFLLLGMVGCASMSSNEMVFREGNESVNLEAGSVCLLSLRTDNQFKPKWPPEVYAIKLINQATNKETNIAVQSRSMGALLKKGFGDALTFNKNTSSWEGLISFQLPPGSYRIAAVRGGCSRSIGIAAAIASFDFPFDVPFHVYDNEYVYLGRIEMTNRKRVSNDEIPSGDNFITRLPQKQSGFGTGTFDVNIYDNYDQDIQKLEEQYPAIRGQTIARRVLPQWTKPNRE